MRTFENQVQLVKYEILKAVSTYALEGTLDEMIPRIPGIVDRGPDPRFRCCIYHERAITAERLRMVMGGDPGNPNLIEVLDAACDQCPTSRYRVTEACRGCIAHRCESSCPVGAIRFFRQQAIIDTVKCISCGRCQQACPYNAIVDCMRPCQRACPTGAIAIDASEKAVIDEALCIRCGACVYRCPFGAMQEKSEIIGLIHALKDDAGPVYAMLAPAFSTQFDYTDLGRVVAGMKRLGFTDVVEVALGADVVVAEEAEEWRHHVSREPFMTTSCCPAFVSFVEKRHGDLAHQVSKSPSPMAATAAIIKRIDPEARVCFIGPCIAKKMEKDREPGAGITDFVLTFEELAALLDAKIPDLSALEPAPLNNASDKARGFAASGGVTAAIEAHIADKKLPTAFLPLAGDGIARCDQLLKIARAGRLEGNFIEGMACEGGCIKGPVTMHHGKKDEKALRAYCQGALEKSTEDALRILRASGIAT